MSLKYIYIYNKIGRKRLQFLRAERDLKNLNVAELLDDRRDNTYYDHHF
jgi:hypothetical protein